jgi:hypothetical protein
MADRPQETHGASSVKLTLARAFVGFQDKYLSSYPSQGLLCQAWIPSIQYTGQCGHGDSNSNPNATVLATKGNPFFVAGQSGADLLALFRCVSCRFKFGTDIRTPQELGAPGRVYISAKPEMLVNVQNLNGEDYHRSEGAKLCSVKSCILVPVFTLESDQVIAIVEILTNNTDLEYARMCLMVAEQLAKYNFRTCPLSDVQECAGEVSPAFLQDQSHTTPFIHESKLYVHAPSMTGDEVDGSGFVSGRDSAKLGLPLADLKTLMKKKKVKTLSRNSMGRYEQEVNMFLSNQGRAGAPLRKMPSSKGIDSRWHAVRRVPHTKSKRRKADEFPDGGFPLLPSQQGGRIMPDYNMISQSLSAKNMKLKIPDAGVQEGGTSAENITSTSDSDDWMGMIDPAMLELMVNDHGLDELGDLSNLDVI